MINRLHSFFHDPRRGWDPIPKAYADSYGQLSGVDPSVVDRFEQAVDGLTGKVVVDVGSGPGHYSAEFARRGARVVCFDVSRTYLAMAERRVAAAGGSGRFLVGYMDWVDWATDHDYDAAFSNVAWNYCFNDFSFARALLGSVRQNGVVFVRETTEDFVQNKSRYERIVYWANRHLGTKVGHPRPPAGRIATAFRKAGAVTVSVEQPAPSLEVVIARRP